MANIVGVDYGAKMSGNTVLAHYMNGEIHFSQVEKKKDADAWLTKELETLQADVVYLDAPLSLPAAYFGNGESYHYREADKITRAMSPMFLGGLTARAMSLKASLSPLIFHEIYPAFFQSELIQSIHYKEDITLFLQDLAKRESFTLREQPTNWHQVDALMALLIGTRHQEQRHQEIGNPTEGIIII
jgi:predicted nuclease with RNAse H fold